MSYSDKFRAENSETIPHRKRQARLRVWQRALDVLGGRCCRCGFADIRALLIDHFAGGGSAERRLHQSNWVPAQVAKGRVAGYRLLCANCDSIKRHENQE